MSLLLISAIGCSFVQFFQGAICLLLAIPQGVADMRVRTIVQEIPAVLFRFFHFRQPRQQATAIYFSNLLLFPRLLSASLSKQWFPRCSGWKAIGVLIGVMLFLGITSHAVPVQAQLFDTVEQEAETIFGAYLEKGIIGFLFGVLRIVIWVTAVGFIFFAVYQAQRGEQWQPLLQNAFIVIAAVVVVEGLSQLFFGST